VGKKKLTPKICDFGLSYKEDDYPMEKAPTKLPITIMPPEDLKEKGKVRTKGSDIWALGILIWQIHTAREPYQLDVVKDPNDLYGTETISLKELAKQIINDDKKNQQILMKMNEWVIFSDTSSTNVGIEIQKPESQLIKSLKC